MPILKDNFEILASGTLKTPTCKVIFLKLAASANIAFILGKKWWQICRGRRQNGFIPCFHAGITKKSIKCWRFFEGERNNLEKKRQSWHMVD